MKREEKLAHDYLVSLGLGPIMYEPEPNLPPDFLINGSIAVEVRRLNQNEITESGEHRGLEETWIPFNVRFRKLLSSLGPPRAGISWYVTCRIRRPLTSWEKLRPALKRWLTGIQETACLNPLTVHVDEGLEIRLHPSTKVHSTAFVWLGASDGDSGGFVVHEMMKNLKICIVGKSRIVAPHRHKYPEWWLVFLDFIGRGLSHFDQQILVQHWYMEHDWDKIVIVSPGDPCSAFDLPASIALSK